MIVPSPLDEGLSAKMLVVEVTWLIPHGGFWALARQESELEANAIANVAAIKSMSATQRGFLKRRIRLLGVLFWSIVGVLLILFDSITYRF